ncbi:hypothetical protein QYE76_009618 [Lolium multiflorum]|uniref:Uncharacterized protein n=1 Tax=Lolium multiflorum TaxID=4521 RepID=A0AAD8TTG3_LOLMU|nr:hypothetical protein QYE76_009618 [Lolium multiflorum]
MRGSAFSNEDYETKLLVVMVCAGTHRSFVGNHVPRRCTPARWLNGATDVDRMRVCSTDAEAHREAQVDETDARRFGEALRWSLASGGVLIPVEDVAEAPLCAVDAGKEEEVQGDISGSRGRRQRMGEDVVYPLKVTLEELYNGTSKKLSLSRNVLCSKCNG